MEPKSVTHDRILWHRADTPGHEACRVVAHEAAWRVEGVALFLHEGRSCRLDYNVYCDAVWRTRAARVSGWVGERTIAVEIDVDAARRWRLDRLEQPELAGCIDVDLNFSPSTNLLPIRRLALEIGQEAAVRAAWLRFPDFTLEVLEQTYRRTGERTYHYESAGGAFAADLEVDETGFVTSYAVWHAEDARASTMRAGSGYI